MVHQAPADTSTTSRGFRATPLIPHKRRPCRTYLATPLPLCRKRSTLQERIALHGGVAATLSPIDPLQHSETPRALQSPRPPTEVPNVRQPKNSRKGCRVGHGKTAEKQPEKHPKNTRKTPENSQNSCFSGVSGVFPAVFRLFHRDPLGTLFGCFSAVFNVGHLAPL